MKRIRHKGIIDSISGCKASVRIVRASACSSCEAKSTCRGHGVKDFIVNVTDEVLVGMSAGDAVTVEIPCSAGRHAVFVGFVVPLLLVVVSMSVIALLGGGDVPAVLAAIGVLAMYYCGLYVARQRLDRHFHVSVVGS